MTFPFGDKRSLENIYWDFKRNTASGTCSAMAGPGVLGSIFINGGTMGIVTITDGLNASGTGGNIVHFTPSVTGESFDFNVRCRYGCSVFASAATDYTVFFMR